MGNKNFDPRVKSQISVYGVQEFTIIIKMIRFFLVLAGHIFHPALSQLELCGFGKTKM